MAGALTTYRYFLPYSVDKTFLNYALHGFFIALSMLPYAWAMDIWMGFWVRTAVLTVLMAVWSHFIKEVNLEEGGRGALIILTLKIL